MKKQASKWKSFMILRALLQEVETFCKNEKHGFANTAQFITYAIRKELDLRKGIFRLK